MKKLWTIVLVMFSAYSLSAQSGYTVKGYLENLTDGKLMLMHRNPLDSRVLVPDSVESKNGAFEINKHHCFRACARGSLYDAYRFQIGKRTTSEPWIEDV